MSKKMSWISVFVFLVSLIISSSASAFQLLSKEDALKQVFFKGAVLETETKTLSGDTLAKVKEELGGSLVHREEGSESAPVPASNKIDFIFAKKNGKRLGVAIIDEEPGKWGPIHFIIAMDVKGKVKAVRVMSYSEIRGRPIARKSFMRQYNNKTIKSTLQVGKDIIGVSGATISSKAATFSVKKALVLYNAFYLKK